MIHDIISRLSLAKMPDVVVPITPATEKIYVKVGGIPFVYKRNNLPDGWMRLRLQKTIASVLPDLPPTPYEILEYMELLRPSLCLIVIYRLDNSTWLCYPYNRSDANQKGWDSNSGPLPIYLVTDSIEPFDVIYACGPINGLIYWRAIGPLPGSDKLVANLGADYIFDESWEVREAWRIARGRIEAEKLRDAKLQKKEKLKTFEGSLAYHLSFLGAELVSWRESGRDVVVEWRDGIYSYSSRIQASMQVTSAGICLSNRDSDFSIASLVDVMREARRLNRPGASGEMSSDYNED